MPDIPTAFKEDELDDIKWAAELQGLTVEEFVSQATNQLVKNIKEDARKRIQNPKSIRVIKSSDLRSPKRS